MNKSTLRAVDVNKVHARDLARVAVAKHREGTAIDSKYDFNAEPRALKEIFYRHTVWFSYRRWYVRFLWWR